jgi:hypothetical protein
MERQPIPLPPLKLTVAAAIDHPAASEILVSFPDKWELVHQMIREDTLLYIAAMPPSQERPRPDRFYGLAPDINLELTTYRLYKFFQPWPMPSVIASWDPTTGTGRVEKMGDIKTQLQPFGQAQVWKGQTCGVLWECYLNEAGREANWQEMLYKIWQIVEKDMGVAKIFSQPHEPTFKEGYPEFLDRLGYQPDPESPGWWSKGK